MESEGQCLVESEGQCLVESEGQCLVQVGHRHFSVLCLARLELMMQ